MGSVHEVIEAFRNTPSNSERGTTFEKLMVRYFELDPMLSQQYDAVWRWVDWPGRRGKTDTGIDLVARERDTGNYTAIQCKFYEPTHTLSKGDIDSFFTASGKTGFTNRVIISTTDRWGKNAEDALADQRKSPNTLPTTTMAMRGFCSGTVDFVVEPDAARVDRAMRARPAGVRGVLGHQGVAIGRGLQRPRCSDPGDHRPAAADARDAALQAGHGADGRVLHLSVAGRKPGKDYGYVSRKNPVKVTTSCWAPTSDQPSMILDPPSPPSVSTWVEAPAP
jgi:hypothetical protein